MIDDSSEEGDAFNKKHGVFKQKPDSRFRNEAKFFTQFGKRGHSKRRKRMRKLAAVALFSAIVGCAVPPASPPSLSPTPSSLSPEPQWNWGVIPVKVVPFDNRTPIKVTQRIRKRVVTRKPLERGITQQFVRVLEQSQAFNVVDESRSVQDEVEEEGRERQTGAKGDGGIAASDEAQIKISGNLNVYDVSSASVVSGVNEDPLLHGLQDDSAAENAFALLVKRAENINQDLIAFAIRLMDVKTDSELGSTSFQCAVDAEEEPRAGWFDERLRQSLPPPRTPIQRATQVCLVRAVNWVGELYDLWRKNPERFLNYRTIQEHLNTLGYNCGSVDGIRGPKTETCIQEFLAKTGNEEKNLESAINEELGKLTLPKEQRSPTAKEEQMSDNDEQTSHAGPQENGPQEHPLSPSGASSATPTDLSHPPAALEGRPTLPEPDLQELPEF